MMSNKLFKKIYFFTFIIFVIAKFTISWKSDVGLSVFDSNSYFNPTFSNPVRMPQLSYIFVFISYFGAISIFQIIFSILSWSLLIASGNLIFKNYRERLLLLTLEGFLAISFPILKFDSIILSESFSINAGILLISSFILIFYKFNYLNFTLFCISLFVFGFPKQSSIFFALVISILVLIITFQRVQKRILKISYIVPITITLVLNSFFFHVSTKNKFIEQQVTLVNIIERSYDNYQLRKYWLNEGFPAITYQVYSSPPFKTPVQMVNDLPQVKSWKIFDYQNPMEQYILTNPLFAILAPVNPQLFIPYYSFYESVFVPLSTGVIELEKTNDLNLRTLSTQPNYFDSINTSRFYYWPTSKFGIKFLMIFIFVNIIIFYLVNLKLKKDQKLRFLISIIFLFFIMGTWANWNMALTYTLDRLLTPWSVVLKLIFIITLIFNLEALRNRFNI